MKSLIVKLMRCAMASLLVFHAFGTLCYAESTTSTTTVEEETSQEEVSEEETSDYSEVPIEQFRVSNLSPQTDTNLDYVDWWYSEWDDCHYVFLPSTADRSNLTITYSADNVVYLNDEPVTSGETVSLLSDEDEYSITVGGVDCGKLKVMQSNLGCIYISTESGGLDALDSNKNLTETGLALMINADGGTEYYGELEKITSHGNSSWDYSKKKPYNIKLPSKANLYGMGKAKKWALLSNYLDHSMLRNKVTEEMSDSAGIEYVMDSVFVDLYADGSYRGTYQLTERVQVQKNRVNITDLEEKTEELNSLALDEYPQLVIGASSANEYIEDSYKCYDIPNNPDDITGGYLLEFQTWGRYGKKADSGFVTSRGQAISIESPEYASEEQTLYIREFVQDLEDAIYSETGYNSKGKHYSEYIDVDSLIKAYLVQEISMNVDATATSFYLWKDSDITGDGKLHFSPPWDFDLSYNNIFTSRSNSDGNVGYSYRADNLFAAYFPINGYLESGRPTLGISWIGQLYKDDDFVRKVARTYFKDFEPFLTNLTEGDSPYITELGESILPSAEMNNARWHTYGGRAYCVFGASSGDTFMESVGILQNFISDRTQWLSELWQPYLYLRGDVNDDGEFNLTDVLLLKKYLLGIDPTIENFENADVYQDGVINVLDLCSMKRELLFG